MNSTLQVVWFKRDLRIEDHEPLAKAAKRGPVLPLYIADPSVIDAPDFDPLHWTFIRASLIELRRRLFAIGQPLVVRTGDTVSVLEAIHASTPIGKIWSHEESGNAVSRERDRRVREWAKARKIRVTEVPSNGIVRNSPTREGWDQQWDEEIRKPVISPPARLQPAAGIEPGPIPDHADLGLPLDTRTRAQHGGETLGHQTLTTFLTRHGESYGQDGSSGSTLWEVSSRISPYLSWGNLSVRQAVHETRARFNLVRALPPPQRGEWPRALAVFESRLRWRSSSVQEFENEPRIETSNLVRAYDALIRPEADSERFDSWASGRTGYPLIDACMRALLATGWINFRMRSLVVSFATFDLWMPWRVPGLHLARVFLDYEPGIHWLQTQIQAGTTETTAARVYNPTKQAQEQDPNGQFIKQWVPELAGVPVSFIHTPWMMPIGMQESSGCLIGTSYPVPIVDHLSASREAQRRMYEVRNQPAAATETAELGERHGIRSSTSRTRRSKKAEQNGPAQLSFPLE